MGVLLGLGSVQLLQAIGGDNVGQDVLGERLGKATSTSNVGSYSVIVTKCESLICSRSKPSNSLSVNTRVI